MKSVFDQARMQLVGNSSPPFYALPLFTLNSSFALKALYLLRAKLF